MVFFTNLSSLATNYSWDFGDSGNSTAANPAHLYTNGGLYSVTLAASGPGGSSSFTRTNYIVVTNVPPPITDFVAGPTNGLGPLMVFFTNLSSLATNYIWDFGDSGNSTATNPSHLYTNAGVYSVTLAASGPGGSSSFTGTNYIVVTNVPPPVTDFVAAPTTGFEPLTVYFTNLSSLATNYSWDFGDGGISTALNPANTYSNAGAYTIKLVAFGPGGTNTFVRTGYVVVSNVPPPVIEAISVSNEVISLTWSSIAGKTYRVQRNDDLSSFNWSNLPPDVPASGASTSQDYPLGPEPQGFYRVQFVP